MASLALIVAGGIYIAAHLPRTSRSARPSRCSRRLCCCWRQPGPLSACPGFAWGRFFDVARWALLAYAIIAGMIDSLSSDGTCAAARWWC